MNEYVDKAIIYPFSDTILQILQYINIPNKKMLITTTIDKKRKFLKGKDLGYIKNRPNTGIIITDDLERELNCRDILIYTDEMNEDICSSSVIDDIQKILKMQKKVICLRSMTDFEVDKLNDLASEMKTEFIYLGKDNQETIITKFEYLPHELYEPEASVIIVGEMFRGLDGEHVCLSLARNIEEIGYNCVTIMDQKYTKILGAYSFPSFLNSNNINESNKVYYMNNFIKYIDQTESPDVIILLMPDAMMKYNNEFCNGFGIKPYIISQAIQADCFIFCTQFDDVDINLFDSMSAVFEKRFGFEIDFIHMSNIMLNIQKSKISGKLSFTHQNFDRLNYIINDKYKNNKIPIFNSLEKEQCKKLSYAVIEKLEGYFYTNSSLI